MRCLGCCKLFSVRFVQQLLTRRLWISSGDVCWGSVVFNSIWLTHHSIAPVHWRCGGVYRLFCWHKRLLLLTCLGLELLLCCAAAARPQGGVRLRTCGHGPRALSVVWCVLCCGVNGLLRTWERWKTNVHRPHCLEGSFKYIELDWIL